ncbi:FadR/GntR family transcriptional regulator [Xanthobacter autotrophicus]|uniref:FadR/GntR family transcriptional regulator n=1 Tax=Xanthobacter autotrophicus TaxID=280 RepID=UPI003726D1D3
MLDIERLRLPPAYQAVSLELQRRILSGALKPGEALPSETELAERFGVNRSTVREGIRQLESEGLVRRESRKRLLVAVPNTTDLAQRHTRNLVMHEVTFRELWDVANVLEPLAAELAAVNLSEGDLKALGENIKQTAAAIQRGESPGELDLEFHNMISAGAGNRALLLAREPIGLLLYPAFELIRPDLPQAAGRLLEAHKKIYAALKRRDAEGARTWSAKHIADLRRGWELLKRDFDTKVSPPG